MDQGPDYEGQRARMVRRQLARRGISDPRVLDALGRVPREAFVAPDLVSSAYADGPLPIGDGQTISQPYIVAFTAEALQLRPESRVLDVGTGSGYAAAVFASIVREVYGIERVEKLCHSARARLAELGYTNVHVRCGDGTLGWPEHAPYDAIAVGAVGPRLPPALLEQLTVGGRLVMPVGPDGEQVLMLLERTGVNSYREEPLVGVRFVPLIGEQGFARNAASAER
jgi:protein-L-isoaspartate(D-aspartate) O-methyltransferase